MVGVSGTGRGNCECVSGFIWHVGEAYRKAHPWVHALILSQRAVLDGMAFEKIQDGSLRCCLWRS